MMTNYREILRLRSLGINHKQIAESMGIAPSNGGYNAAKSVRAGASKGEVKGLHPNSRG